MIDLNKLDKLYRNSKEDPGPFITAMFKHYEEISEDLRLLKAMVLELTKLRQTL